MIVIQITEIKLDKQKKLHIFLCIDIHSNNVIASSISRKTVTSNAIVKALSRAIEKRFAAEPILKVIDAYPFHLPPSFFSYSNNTSLEVKLSIILALAQESSIQKTYSVQSFLNQFRKRRHSIQAQVKKEILNEFQNLLKYKIIEHRFVFEDENNQQIISKQKDNIQLEDIKSLFYQFLL